MRLLIITGTLLVACNSMAQTAPEGAMVPVAGYGQMMMPPSTVALGNDYSLRANDVVSINVFQEPELGCTERIAGDGTISVPLVGRIRIVGMSPVGASKAIRDALEADYLVNPQVSLSVTEATKQYFTLLGQVSSPGAYALPVSGKLSLMQAIGMAGGFTRLASPGRITVKRITNGEERLFKVDGEKLASGKGSEIFEVYPGDVITIKERIF